MAHSHTFTCASHCEHQYGFHSPPFLHIFSTFFWTPTSNLFEEYQDCWIWKLKSTYDTIRSTRAKEMKSALGQEFIPLWRKMHVRIWTLSSLKCSKSQSRYIDILQPSPISPLLRYDCRITCCIYETNTWSLNMRYYLSDLTTFGNFERWWIHLPSSTTSQYVIGHLVLPDR